MESSTKKILIGTSIFFTTMIIAILGYWSAGWSLLEAVYMVVITIYGIGYGEVRPLDDPRLRLFTMGFIVTGCTSAVFVMGGFVQMIAEGEINKALGARRMNEGIRKLQQHAIICGFGRVGQILAAELTEAKTPFVIVDRDRERIAEAESLEYLVFVGDATEETTLSAVGISRASVLATVLPNDALNVYITLSARELNETIQIIARGECPSTKRKLIRSGANEVVMPAAVGATKIAHLITHRGDSLTSVFNFDETEERSRIEDAGICLQQIEIDTDSSHIGQSLEELEISLGHELMFVLLKRIDGNSMTQPERSSLVEQGDSIVFLSHEPVDEIDLFESFESIFK